MIFAIEGIITMMLALLAYFTMTDRPETARWMSDEEKEIAINRVKSERLAQAVLLDKIDGVRLKRGFTNPVTHATAASFLLVNIIVLGISLFLPTIISTIYPGLTIVQKQLLTCATVYCGCWSYCDHHNTKLAFKLPSNLDCTYRPTCRRGVCDLPGNHGRKYSICGRIFLCFYGILSWCYDKRAS